MSPEKSGKPAMGASGPTRSPSIPSRGELRRDLDALRRRSFGIALFVLAAIIFYFTLGTTSSSATTFSLSAAPAIALPLIHLPLAVTELALGLICVLLGLAQLLWRNTRRVYLFLGIGLALTGVAFLAWAGKGQSVDVEGLLIASLIEAVPLTLGALSGLICERSGVINIAIEGQFLVSAFVGALVGSATGNLWAGLVCGALAGGLIGLVLAVFAITYAADQIIVGVVLDAFALGLTSFFLQSVLVPDQATLNSPSVFDPISIPLLDRIPVIGPILFNQNIIVYLTILILVAVQVGLFHTRWGLRVRAVGEHPRAADTVGINVKAVRYCNVVLGGIVAGIGGASFTIGSTGQFAYNMTAGLGYIALAAMIFGRWRPFGALGAALLFGFTDALQFTLSVLNVPIPSSFLTMFPYLATILAVAGLVGRVLPPAADGQHYARE
ncbi:MAG: ABC transporter permease [Rectinemataceae bacterium]